MSRSRLPAVAVVLALAAAACVSDPCQDYVDYICACHADDPQWDCDELRTAYENADPELEDECQIALADQQAADEAEGYVCATGTTGATTTYGGTDTGG